MYPKLLLMLFPKTTIKEFSMKCFRIQMEDEKMYDIFIPDIYDMSSIVMVTDFNGDMVPYEQWDNIGEILKSHLEEEVY